MAFVWGIKNSEQNFTNIDRLLPLLVRYKYKTISNFIVLTLVQKLYQC